MIRSVERWLHSGKEVTEDEIKRTLAPYSSATTPDKEVKK